MPAASAPAMESGTALSSAGTEGLRISVVGAGNWGSAASIIIGRNVRKFEKFSNEVRLWVYEEIIDGKKLSETINETHVNVKYLPNHTLPDNIVAVPDLKDACTGADVLVFVLPHQFLPRTCQALKGIVSDNAIGISLIKGIEFDEDGVILMSDVIERELGIPMSVLSGANIANEIADGKFCESTIGYTSPEAGATFFEMFNSPTFRIQLSTDIAGIQVFGALKNVVALGAGFVDALEFGNNTKAALIRIGMLEIARFAQHFFENSNPMTMSESAGVADLITTCSGGRNRRVSEAFAKANGKRPWAELEQEMLGGQKLQGTSTCEEVMKVLKKSNVVDMFPLLSLIYSIAFEGAPPKDIIRLPMESPRSALSASKAHSVVS